MPINDTLLPTCLWQEEHKRFAHPQEKQAVPKRSNWFERCCSYLMLLSVQDSTWGLKWLGTLGWSLALQRWGSCICLSSPVWEVMNSLKVPCLQRQAGWSVKKVRNLASCFLYLSPSVSAVPKMSKHLVMAQGAAWLTICINLSRKLILGETLDGWQRKTWMDSLSLAEKNQGDVKSL